MDSGSPSNADKHDGEKQDDRPPGGTRRSGAKTPRKVQWLPDEREDPTASSRALDEHGLDPEAFENLTDALERHHRSELPAPGNNYNNLTPSTTSSMSPYLSPTHEVPGESFIDRNETAGLPGSGTTRQSVQKAEEVINAHRHSFFDHIGLHHRGNKNKSKKDGSSKDKHNEKPHRRRRSWFVSSDTEPDSDVEKSAMSSQTTLRPATGVLSALLSLYDHHSGSQSSFSTTPGRTSMEDPLVSPGSGRSLTFDSEASVPLPPPRAQTMPHGPFNASNLSLRSPNLTWAKGIGIHEPRMPHARNGAGVFGPLIASTGNISGVAAPTSSSIAPNVKRPGYHLSRYSLESNVPSANRPDLRKTLSRPRSMHFDFGPQEIQHSENASSRSGSSGKDGKDGAVDDVSPVSLASSTGNGRQKWTGVLRDLPKRGWNSRAGTPSTPGTPEDEWFHEKQHAAEERKKERRAARRKKATIFITRHVAEIVQRQEFILKLARAMMMFGGPTHRFQALVQSTAKVLEISLSCMYLPDVMLISFDDSSTGTSNIKFIRQGSALDLGKLQDAHEVYWKVIHDDISVKDASIDLDNLMRKRPLYSAWQLILIGGFCSSAICSVSFNGSFIDSLVSFPLGCLLIVIQLSSARNELYSNIFEITVTTIFSFVSAALASYHHFCYSAIASASIVLILPGFIVLCGSLELASRNIVSGAVRICFSLIYSLFLGFGLAIGATAYSKMTHKPLAGASDLSCQSSHDPHGPWYQRTPSLWWAFLTVPMYSLFLSLRNQAPWWRKETLLLVVISSIGWVTNHFTGTKFPNQSDISAAVGALAVGITANLYGRAFNGNAFVVMITGILFQLPSGLANGGLFTFVTAETSGSSDNESYLSGFQVALQLVAVSIGLTVGLGISLVVVHPFQSRRRAGGMFSL